MPKKSNIIDERDRRILVELDKNARQTDSEIAKKIGTSKQVVNYRVQKLVSDGIISNFYTIINTGKLGFNSYYLFLQLEKLNKQKEIELLKKITELDYVGWLVSGTGRWDAIALIYANSIKTFNDSLNQLINLCGENLHEYNFTTLISAEHISYKFLGEKRDLHSVRQTEKEKPRELDATDVKILEEISQNSRQPITIIAQKTKIPVHVVNYHLKKLIKDKIIEGFKPKINVNKLGVQWHLLLIQFQQSSEERKQKFINYCKQHSKIYYVTSTIGAYNLMLDIHVKSTEEFKGVLLDLKEKYSDVIKIYESIIIFNEYKISYFPRNLIT